MTCAEREKTFKPKIGSFLLFFATERLVEKICSAIVRFSSELVRISSELVEISSELVRTISELLIISAFKKSPIRLPAHLRCGKISAYVRWSFYHCSPFGQLCSNYLQKATQAKQARSADAAKRTARVEAAPGAVGAGNGFFRAKS